MAILGFRVQAFGNSHNSKPSNCSNNNNNNTDSNDQNSNSNNSNDRGSGCWGSNTSHPCSTLYSTSLETCLVGILRKWNPLRDLKE